MDPDYIHCCEQLYFRAIEDPPGGYQAKDFVLGLDSVGHRDFRVAARILTTSLASGRPPSGRAERIAGSRVGLFELRITPPGRRGPHARMLYIREGNTIWCARGLLKRERISRKDIELADRAVQRFRTARP